MVDSPPDRPCPRKSKVTTPPDWFSRLATFQTNGRDHDSVKPCAMTIASSRPPGRWIASIGTPSVVTRVSAFSTGALISPFCVTGCGNQGGPGRPRAGDHAIADSEIGEPARPGSPRG